MITFEDYLEELFMSQYTGTDDNAPDAFNIWLENLSLDTLIGAGNSYGKIMSNNEPH